MKQDAHIVTMGVAASNPESLTLGPLCFKHNMIWEDYALHTHDCYELEMVVEGTGMEWLNGTARPLMPGSIFLLSPGDLHRFSTNMPLKLLSIKINDERLPDDVAHLLSKCQGGVFAQLADDTYHEVMGYFQGVERELTERDRYFDQRVYAWLVLIVTRLLRLSEHMGPAADTQQILQYLSSALEYIQKNIDNALTLSEVASHCCLSPCYFSTLFARHIGCGFSKYLSDKRVQKACLLLRTTDLPIASIALSCGFGSISNFQRTFRTKMKKNPSLYRDTEVSIMA